VLVLLFSQFEKLLWSPQHLLPFEVIFQRNFHLV